MVGLDGRQTGELRRIVLMMGQRMEGIRHADHVVGAHADLLRDHEGGDACLVGLPGQRNHLEVHIEQFREILRDTERRIG